MKKIVSAVLCLCLLLFAAASAEEETGENDFLLRIWNESGLEFSYLRFDFYAGGDYVGLVCSCPNEGEDFYRCPYSPQTAEELKDLRIECSYGVSELSPEDAILQVMMGNPGEEHPLLTVDLIPECGKVYDLKLISDGGDGWLLVPVETE